MRNLKSALADVLAVVRSDDYRLQELLEEEGIAVHACQDAQQGMSRSFVCGIGASENADGWVIALGDMPFLLPQTIKSVAARIAQSGHIAVPSYLGQRGHPIGFGRRYLNELLKLRGDEGARSVIASHPREVEIVECQDRGILLDIDAPGDLETQR